MTSVKCDLVRYLLTMINNNIEIAEKIRLGIESLSLIPDHKVTVSIGVTDLSSVTGWKQWMKIGDKNLYKAKNVGRNRVVVSQG